MWGKVHQRTDEPGWWVFIHYRGQRRKKSFGKNKALAVEFANKLDAKLTLGEAGVRTQSGGSFGCFEKFKILCVGSNVTRGHSFLGGHSP
jgi:hypothetical protein